MVKRLALSRKAPPLSNVLESDNVAEFSNTIAGKLGDIDRDRPIDYTNSIELCHLLQKDADKFMKADPLREYVQPEPVKNNQYDFLRECEGFQIISRQADRNLSGERLLGFTLYATGRLREFRSFKVATSADDTGKQVYFAAPSQIPELIHRYCTTYNQNIAQHPVELAVWSLVALTNIHPLGDGNGRLSRFLASCILSDLTYAEQKTYIPLTWIRVLDSSTYLLAIRRAELQNDWKPLFELVLGFLELYEHVLSIRG